LSNQKKGLNGIVSTVDPGISIQLIYPIQMRTHGGRGLCVL